MSSKQNQNLGQPVPVMSRHTDLNFIISVSPLSPVFARPPSREKCFEMPVETSTGMKPNLRAKLPTSYPCLCLDKTFPACTFERGRVCTRALRIIRFGVPSVDVGWRITSISSSRCLSPPPFCSPLLHLCGDESRSILKTLGCYLHRPREPSLNRVKALGLIW